MQVFPFPVPAAHLKLEFRKASFQDFALAASSARFRISGGNLLQIVAHQAGQSGVLLDSNFAHLFNEIFVQ